MKLRTSILYILTAGFAMAARAEVKLPAFFSNNMVMQQNTQCNLWGTADANKTVRIKTSWNKKTYQVKSDKDGKWKLQVSTPKAGGPFSMTFNDGQETRIDNILIGELWICSGQSNMEMPIKGFKNQPVEGATQAMLRGKNNQIRLFTVGRKASIEPLSDVKGHWAPATPETIREFSATAFFYGQILQEQLGVPIGLLVASWGGSACEAWSAGEWLKAFPQVKLPKSQAEVDKTKQRCPTALYNGMLQPLVGLTIAGVIWYQGEDNWPRYSYYSDLFAGMVKGWREMWQQGNFPFYYCQIAPYNYELITAASQDTINSALLREQQMKAETMIPNCGMAVLLDAGLETGIHPMKKQVAGERLARLALAKTYGVGGITAESPRYNHIEVSNDTVTVFFDHADMWINCRGKFTSDNFEVAGSDRIFHPAKAWISRSKMLVKSDKVAHPVAVRYGFKDWVVGDVFSDDLPVSSFRSDNW